MVYVCNSIVVWFKIPLSLFQTKPFLPFKCQCGTEKPFSSLSMFVIEDGYLLLEPNMSFGPGDMGSTQYWHRQSFPLKVTLSPAGKGRLGDIDKSVNKIDMSCSPIIRVYDWLMSLSQMMQESSGFFMGALTTPLNYELCELEWRVGW